MQLRNQLMGLQSAQRSLVNFLRLQLGAMEDEAYERKVKELARTDPTLLAVLSQEAEA